MAGVDRNTGRLIAGWPHVEQSIGVILTTPKVSRVMRRAFGSDLPRLVDAPMSATNVVDFYVAVATSIRENEPRFRVARMSVAAATPGAITLLADGVYYPRGHLGDYTISEPATVSVPL